MNKVLLFLLVPTLALALAACVRPDAETMSEATWAGPHESFLPTPQQVIDAYRPRNVTLLLIYMDDSTDFEFDEDQFDIDDVASEHFEWQAANRTLQFNQPNGLWRFQDDDIVLAGIYRLNSSKHEVVKYSYSIEPLTEDAQITLGGFTFIVYPWSENQASVWLGGLGPTSFREPRSGLVMPATILHESVFPMRNQRGTSNSSIDYVRANVQTEIRFEYKGRVTLAVDPPIVDSMTRDPSRLDKLLHQHAQDFGLGNRFGQYSDGCLAWAMKSHDPCMNQYSWPTA